MSCGSPRSRRRARWLDKKIGSITAGKRADFAILAGDPLAEIAQLRSIERTVRAGVLSRARRCGRGVRP
jgi:imidazolonepropionase-like amidohydrolase